jgi:hypothetical protein
MLIKKYADETKDKLVTPEMTKNSQVIKIKIASKTGKQNKKAQENFMFVS